MSEYYQNVGELQDLKKRKQICEATIQSHKESMRNALPLTAEASELDGEYIISLAVQLNEHLSELKAYTKKIEILSRAVGG